MEFMTMTNRKVLIFITLGYKSAFGQAYYIGEMLETYYKVGHHDSVRSGRAPATYAEKSKQSLA